MDALAYFAAVAALTLAALVSLRHDRHCAVLLVGVLVLFAGTRTGGFDYDEYMEMIGWYRADATLSAGDLMLTAKDPLFGLVVWCVERLRGDDAWVLLVMAVMAGLSKLAFVWGMPAGRTAFLALYAALLAPGLEFAAVRAGVAIGFLGLAVVSIHSRFKRVGYSALAVASHVSLLIGAFFALARWNVTRRNAALVTVAITGGTFILASALFALLPPEVARFSDYADNRGTLYALAPPLVTLAVILLGASPEAVAGAAADAPEVAVAYRVAVGLSSAAVGVAIPIVTASTRLMEVSWFFGLYALFRLALEHPTRRARLALGCLVVLTSAFNVMRGTWTALGSLGVIG